MVMEGHTVVYAGSVGGGGGEKYYLVCWMSNIEF